MQTSDLFPGSPLAPRSSDMERLWSILRFEFLPTAGFLDFLRWEYEVRVMGSPFERWLYAWIEGWRNWIMFMDSLLYWMSTPIRGLPPVFGSPPLLVLGVVIFTGIAFWYILSREEKVEELSDYALEQREAERLDAEGHLREAKALLVRGATETEEEDAKETVRMCRQAAERQMRRRVRYEDGDPLDYLLEYVEHFTAAGFADFANVSLAQMGEMHGMEKAMLLLHVHRLALGWIKRDEIPPHRHPILFAAVRELVRAHVPRPISR